MVLFQFDFLMKIILSYCGNFIMLIYRLSDMWRWLSDQMWMGRAGRGRGALMADS